MDFRTETVAELARRVRAGETSARELTDHALGRIEALNPALNAFVAVDAEAARAEAEAVDARVAAGEDPGPLAGIPIGVKDLEDAAGFVTTYGSSLHVDDAPATTDSVLVARLRAAGCVVLGKTNTPEHGWMGDTISPPFGATLNPWDTTRSPGGSSGGSAAALAAGMVPLATGSDGGGSIRIPSSLCGFSGLKATQGRIPAGGPAGPGSGLLGVKGPMALRIRDVALALDVAAGPDTSDPYALPAPGLSYAEALQAPVPPRRVLWAPTMGYAVDTEVRAVTERAVQTLEVLGTEVVDVDDRFGSTVFADDPVMPWFTLWTAYRHRAQGRYRGTDDWEKIDPGLRFQIDYAAANVTPDDVIEAQAQIYRHNADLATLFESAPLLLCPTVAGQTGRSGGQGTIDGEESITWVRFTYPFNLTRHPAGTVCAGYAPDGLPLGLQVVGRHGHEHEVLACLAVLEDALGNNRLAPI